MVVSDLYISLTIGMVLALIFCEIFGVAPSGIIVPGYLALSFDQPLMILSVFGISIITYFIVTKVLSKFMILYGRRKFVAMLMVALVLKLAFDLIYPFYPLEGFEIRGIGAIVPGIIANTMEKQGWAYTIGSTTLLSFATYLLLLGIILFRG